jgi:crotonobetainyl-CoA hydratase
MTVIYEKRDRIAYITLNRPEVMNALNNQTWDELRSIWEDFSNDREILVAIITGAGEKAFSAGVDLQEVRKGIIDDPTQTFWNPDLAKIKLPHDIRKPIIAAVNGYCMGVALSLILSCDIRIASENASFSVPEVKMGMAARGLAISLARTMPSSLVMEMLLTGDPISAQEAYNYGLISKLVVLKDLMPTAEKMAKAIRENAPLAVRANKETVWKGMDLPFEHASRLAVSLNYAVLNSEDFKEGLQAIKEKRKPMYKGR